MNLHGEWKQEECSYICVETHVVPGAPWRKRAKERLSDLIPVGGLVFEWVILFWLGDSKPEAS